MIDREISSFSGEYVSWHRLLCSVLLLLTFLVLVMVWPLAAFAAAPVNGDFTLELTVNGIDISALDTIVVDPDEELIIGIHIYNVTREMTLENVQVSVTFAGQSFVTMVHSLGGHRIDAGDEYHNNDIRVSPRETLMFGDLTLTRGIYPADVRLEYTVSAQPDAWHESKDIRIPGNPLTTPVGAASAIVTLGTVAAGALLLKAVISPGLAAGVALPGSVSVTLTSVLYDFALDRLEPVTRGRVMANIVKAAKSRIVKERCPICNNRFRHGHCYTCQKSAKEVRGEYEERVQSLSLQAAKLLASGEVTNLNGLCSRLDINTKLGTDILAVLRNAKMVKIKGITGKLMGKALMMGIGMGLSTILWVTVGGLAVLSVPVLIIILVASIVIPIALTMGLQMKARHDLRRMA